MIFQGKKKESAILVGSFVFCAFRDFAQILEIGLTFSGFDAIMSLQSRIRQAFRAYAAGNAYCTFSSRTSLQSGRTRNNGNGFYRKLRRGNPISQIALIGTSVFTAACKVRRVRAFFVLSFANCHTPAYKAPRYTPASSRRSTTPAEWRRSRKARPPFPLQRRQRCRYPRPD